MKYRGISERDFDTLNSLSVLQSLYNGAKAKQLSLLDDTMMKEFKGITNALIETLKNYASRLTQRAPTKYNPINEYKTLSEETIKLTDEMAKGIPAPPLNCCEKLIYETQVLAVVAELCTEFTNTTQMLLFEKCEHCAMDSDENENGNGENRVGSFVDTLTDVLCAIGHSVIYEYTQHLVSNFYSFHFLFFLFFIRQHYHHTKASLNRHHCCLWHWPKVTNRRTQAIHYYCICFKQLFIVNQF